MDGSSLDYLLLGLLGSGPRSGYDLRKQISGSPLRAYSDSPGAIYPALRRLVTRGWLEAGAPQGPRRRRTYDWTAPGGEAFGAWLGKAVTREDVESGIDDLLLRFAFMGTVLPMTQVRGFLEQFEKELAAYLGTLRQFHASEAAGLPPTARLAFEYGIAEYQARVRWARKAREVLAPGRTEKKRGGKT